MKKIPIIITIMLLGTLLTSCGNSKLSVDKSIEELQENVKNDPNNEAAHYSLGIGYIAENNYPEAIAAFKEALKINYHFSEAHFAIYCAELAADRDLLEEFDEKKPDEEYVEKIKELKRHMAMAIMSYPFFEWKLAFLLLPTKERATTAEEMELYDTFYAIFRDGYENFYVGNYEEAVNNFTHFINDVPTFPEEKKMLEAMAIHHKRPYEVLLSDYKKEAKIFRGLSYALNKDYNSAIKDFIAIADSLNAVNREKILSVYLNSSEVYFFLGFCYSKLNMLSEAEAAFKKTLIEDYSFYMAHHHLSDIYNRQNKYKDALDELDAALLVAPNDATMHYNKAVFLFQMKKYREALVEYENTVNLNAKNYKAHYNAALIYEALKDYKQALAHYQGFLDSAPIRETDLIAKAKEKLNSLKSN